MNETKPGNPDGSVSSLCSSSSYDTVQIMRAELLCAVIECHDYASLYARCMEMVDRYKDVPGWLTVGKPDNPTDLRDAASQLREMLDAIWAETKKPLDDIDCREIAN
jgi:hypothetical protein